MSTRSEVTEKEINATMPRLRQVSRNDVHDEIVDSIYQRIFGDRDPVSQPGTSTGSRGDWWTVYALVPDLLRYVADGADLYASPKRKIARPLRQICQTRAGWARGSQFVFSQHSKFSRQAGVSEDKVVAIPSWQVAHSFDPIERAALAYTDCLVLDGGRVPDAVFDEVRRYLSDEEILELTFIVCFYEMQSTMCRALRLEFDDRDDHVQEVPAP